MNYTDILAEKAQFGEVKTYEVHDIHDFDNAMDELADLDTADEQAHDRYDKQVKPWKAFLDATLAQNQKRRDFLQREVLGYVLDHNDGKSLKSARGAVKTRRVPAGVHASNVPEMKAELVEYAKQNGYDDAIKVTESVTAKLKEDAGITVADGKVVDKDGQLVPGYEATPEHTSVKFDKEGF